MELTTGSRLGPYEIVSRIGAGGMGEVFRARDTRLDRSVAIKILPSDFAPSAEMRARFEREARAISRLNHPHICTIHDVGHENGIDYLVMELIDGQPLSDILAKGPLPTDQVLRYGTHIADALSRAHKAGVVHRDLKPGNIMITRNGAKLLDFGLAKSGLESDNDAPAETLQKPLTAEGTIVGTFQYMAPEQIEGKEADQRTDIFSFGVVLYEMATGRRAFEGKTRTSLIAAIVASEPASISQVQPLAPAALDRFIRKCIAKDPEDRWQCAADLKWELQRIHSEVAAPAAAAPSRNSRIAWSVATAALLAAAIIAGFALRRGSNVRPIRFTIGPPPGWTVAVDYNLGPMAVSPDGRYVAFPAREDVTGRVLIWIRDLASTQSRALPGTDGAGMSFWSPDSSAIGFFAGGYLKRVDLGGGAPQTLCVAAWGRGGAWSQNNEILFSPGPNAPLYRVSATGGVPQQVTRLDRSQKEITHRYPQFLPDGKHFLFLVRSPSTREHLGDSIFAASLDAPKPKFVINVSSTVSYADPGYLLFLRDRTLIAQRFNPDTLQLEGTPTAVSREPVQYHPSAFGMFSCSRAGVLAYVAGTQNSTLQWLDRSGHIEPAVAVEADYVSPRLTDDQQQILYSLPDETTGNLDIWLYDMKRHVARRMTFDPRDDFAPVLTPDGKRMIFSSNRTGTPNIYIKPVDAQEEEALLPEASADFVESISHDGRTILFRRLSAGMQNDIYSVPVTGGAPGVLVTSRFNDIQPVFSPTGRWVAYASDESGRYEVYATRFPRTESRIQISTDGGMQPVWRGDEKELFYVAPGDRIMSVAIEESGDALRPGPPAHVVDIPFRPSRNDEREYDVTRDGKRLLINNLPRERRSLPITVVLNWQTDLTTQR